MFAEVKKQAKKENRTKIVREAAKAHELMYNLAKHINVYTEDYNHVLMLTELKDEMDRFKVKGKSSGVSDKDHNYCTLISLCIVKIFPHAQI